MLSQESQSVLRSRASTDCGVDTESLPQKVEDTAYGGAMGIPPLLPGLWRTTLFSAGNCLYSITPAQLLSTDPRTLLAITVELLT